MKKPVTHFTWKSTIIVSVMLLTLLAFIGITRNWFGIYDALVGLDGFYRFYVEFTHLSLFPLVMIFIPLFGAFFQILMKDKASEARDWIVITMTFLSIVVTMIMYPSALEGGIALNLPGIMGLGLSFKVDMLGFIMLLITSVIWFLVMVYAHEYMKKEKHTNRFFLFMALTYASVLGTIMAGDLLTMFLFFEMMTIFSYVLVTHSQKDESYEAGYNFVFMGLIGGFALLIALLLLYDKVGDLRFASAISALREEGNVRYWIMGLLIFGFGIKAGMAPVHVWLPRAHPVAPTPASALLSGVMIKIGAFGILRVATSYFFPEKGTVDSYTDPVWLTTKDIGSLIIWIGIITMTIGVFFALQQSNIKKMLAYHSISQMGYIVMGIGIALYLGYKGAMGYSGAIYHIINHALFKSLLFMVAGVVYHHTKEYDMYKLGGLWKKLPLTGTVCLIACLGISGIPLFNGFISKTLLHHGIVEAATYGHPIFRFAEWIFIIVSAGTVCSFIKLFYYVFLRKTKEQYPDLQRDYSTLDIAMSGIALMIVLIGLFPNYILQKLIVPELYMISYDPNFIEHYVEHVHFFAGHDLLTMLVIVILGFMIFFAGVKFHLFHLHLPKWLKLEYILFYPLNYLLRMTCKLMYGDQCPIDAGPLSKLALKDNEHVGFLERFTTMTQVFNRRYETNIIKSDAFIYTACITFVLLYMLFFGVR